MEWHNRNFGLRVLAFLCIWLGLQGCSNDTDRALEMTDSDVSFTQAEQQELASLTVAVEQQEALRAVKRLEYSYGHYLSAGRWQDAAALFSKDAVLIDGEERYNSPALISARLQQKSEALPGQGLLSGRLFEVLLLSPVLNLADDGQNAYGRWRQILMMGNFGESARWEIGINENRYVLEDGEWKFAVMHHYPLFAGDYAEGWRLLKDESQTGVTPVPFHYSSADKAGMPVPADNSQLASAVLMQNPSEQLSQLEARTQRMLDEDDIINLQNSYGYYLDRKMWDDLSELFHAEGSLEFGHSGVYRGPADIRRALDQFGDSLRPDEVFDHVQLQPVVDVADNGTHAHARGFTLQFVGAHEQDSKLGVAVFDNEYIKENGKWMISEVHVITRMLTDYELGWAQDAQAAPQALDGFEASEPGSSSYQPYPSIDLPRLNAVAGKFTSVGQEQNAENNSTGTRLAELGRRLRVLEAYVGTTNVANAYGYSIDEFLWDDMADLFAEHGWKELSYIGRYNGRERVRSSVVDRYGRGGRRANSMTFHQKTQPVVTVSEDGLSAKIRTRLLQFNSSRDNPGSYISGIYEDTTVRENGVWKLSGMDLDYTWSADYIGGWEHTRPNAFTNFVPAPGSLQGDAAPDAALRGRVTPAYPTETVDMGFHYNNPVSGRAPPVLLNN